jgi:acetyl-CoA acyltransferase
MKDVVIIGVGMTRFGRFLDRSPQDLGREAIWNAIEDANIPLKKIEVAYVGNAVGAQLNELKGTIGQHVLTSAGIDAIPVTNVENACSSGSSALRLAVLEVASGSHDVAMAVGVEKMYTGDTAKAAASMASGTPYAKFGFTFVAEYALNLRKWMRKYPAVKVEHFAKVVAKNSKNGSVNPYAQFRKLLSVEDVLKSRMVANPLTLYMCSGIGDGSAAAIVCSKEIARRYTSKPLIEVAACELISGTYTYPDVPHEACSSRAAKRAYEKAGIGPEDVNVAEVHDAMAPAGFCNEGEGARMIDEGTTMITGRIAVNPSGGLAAKGHPVGATGLAQIAEIVWQLRGEAGERQVANPKVGLTQNQGGLVAGDNAACVVTILKR